MANTKKQVFIVGPGYIGHEVIDLLLEDGYGVTALVRRPEAAESFKAQGVSSVMGTLEEVNTIRDQALESDIIIHTATADDLPSVDAIIGAIEQRAGRDQHTIYIHTSGCTFLCDDSNGEYKSDIIYSDQKPADMDARPDSSSHREIDNTIIAGRSRLSSHAKMFIMMPPLIYGAT